jgi:transcriptional regulator with XRE-family HTH domain
MTHVKRNSVGMKIRQIRESRGMSCTELGNKAGMSKQSIYKYERDITKNLPYDVIIRLAMVLEVNPAYLVGWSNKTEIPDDIIREVKSDSEDLVSNIL